MVGELQKCENKKFDKIRMRKDENCDFNFCECIKKNVSEWVSGIWVSQHRTSQFQKLDSLRSNSLTHSRNQNTIGCPFLITQLKIDKV